MTVAHDEEGRPIMSDTDETVYIWTFWNKFDETKVGPIEATWLNIKEQAVKHGQENRGVLWLVCMGDTETMPEGCYGHVQVPRQGRKVNR